MGRKSSILKLSPELRKELERLLLDGSRTQKEITDHIRQLGGNVSKSSVGRHALQFASLQRDLRMVGEIAERMGKELPDLTDHTPVLVQSLQTLIMRARFEVRDDEPIDEKVIAKLAEATRNLVLARRTSAEAEAKIRERTKKECAEDAVDEAKKQGLSAEKVEAFKARILGIQTPGPTGAP